MALARRLHCPRCDKDSDFQLAYGWSTLTCGRCKSAFDCLFAIVQANLRCGHEGGGNSFYSLRLEYCGKEKLIEFRSNTYRELELRSRDEVALVVRRRRVHIVHNFTTGRHVRVQSDTLWLAVLAVILALIVGLVLSMQGRTALDYALPWLK